MAYNPNSVWVSYSTISTFQQCPRAYYLQSVYRHPDTGKKIKLISPPLALGSAVHAVLESLSTMPVEDRFLHPLVNRFEEEWKKYSGKKGGFKNNEQEEEYKKRGVSMIRNVVSRPGPLSELAVKINMELPSYWLSESESIKLCGKIDWLQYIPERDAVNIIDFKTSKSKGESDSLQLPIYHLLVHHCQKRKVEKAAYWYLELDDELEYVDLPDLEECHELVYMEAKKLKLARQLENFQCNEGEDGCRNCRPLESIVRGEAEHVGEDEYDAMVFVYHRDSEDFEDREGTLL